MDHEKGRWQWFQNYIATYLERDLRDLAQVGDLDAFQRVYTMLAFQTGQILSISNIAGDVGLTVSTVKRYESILITSFQNKLLSPYLLNQRKQIIKAPKVMCTDTGLANFFMKNDTVDHMLNSGSWGALLETWVYSELYKELKDLIPRPELHYWRTHNGAEVDFVLKLGKKLIPIEVKSAIQIHSYELRGLKSFIQSQPANTVPYGVVFYQGQHVIRLEENILAIPLRLLY